MKHDKQSYTSASMHLLRDQLRAYSPEAAPSVSLTDPRFTLFSATVKVDFSFTPSFTTQPADSPKPASGDLPSHQAGEEALKAEFEALHAKLKSTPPFDANEGPFRLARVPRTSRDRSSVHYRQVCGTCSGKKQVRCKTCRGQGRHTCPTCDARTEMECTECRGSGKTSTFTGEQVTCARCSGSRRNPCDACARTGYVPCNTCKGRRLVPCKPCSGFGQTRHCMAMTITSSLSASLVQSNPSAAALQDVFDAFGGLADLHHDVGLVRSHTIRTGSVSYAIDVPVVSIAASLRDHSSFCVVAGSNPRLVRTGDFLEKHLAQSFDALTQLLRSTNSVTCSPSRVRAALLDFLDSGSHRACIDPASPTIPGITSAYALNVRRLVLDGATQLRQNTLFRFLSAGLVVAPICYVFAHRIFGMHPLDAVSVALVAPAASYAFAMASSIITMRSLGISDDSYRFLQSFAPSRSA